MKLRILLLFVPAYIYGQNDLKYTTSYGISPTVGYSIGCNNANGLFEWVPSGNGIVAYGDSLGETTNVDTVCTFTTLSDGTFRVGGYINVTAVAGGEFAIMRVSFTDVNSVFQFIDIPSLGNTSIVGFSPFSTMDIRVKSGSIITIYSLLNGGGSITYDAGGSIMKLY